MSDITQILDACSAVLKFLYERNEELLRRRINFSLFSRSIRKIEEGILLDPRSLLYHVTDQNILIMQILEILDHYPLAKPHMRAFRDGNGKTAIYIMRCRGFDKELDRCFNGFI